MCPRYQLFWKLPSLVCIFNTHTHTHILNKTIYWESDEMLSVSEQHLLWDLRNATKLCAWFPHLASEDGWTPVRLSGKRREATWKSNCKVHHSPAVFAVSMALPHTTYLSQQHCREVSLCLSEFQPKDMWCAKASRLCLAPALASFPLSMLYCLHGTAETRAWTRKLLYHLMFTKRLQHL